MRRCTIEFLKYLVKAQRKEKAHLNRIKFSTKNSENHNNNRLYTKSTQIIYFLKFSGISLKSQRNVGGLGINEHLLKMI